MYEECKSFEMENGERLFSRDKERTNKQSSRRAFICDGPVT